MDQAAHQFRERVTFSYSQVRLARAALFAGVALCVAPAVFQRFETAFLAATIPAGLVLLFGGLRSIKRDTRIAAVHFNERGFWFYRVNGAMSSIIPQILVEVRLQSEAAPREKTEKAVLYLRGESGVELNLRQKHTRRDLPGLCAKLKTAYRLNP